MKTFALLALILLAVAVDSPRTSAQSCTTATCTAASASESDFLAALPSSKNTNATVVVNIPAGTSSWTTPFMYNVPSGVTNLTIQGATTVNCTGTAGTSSYGCTASDATVIADSIPGNTWFQLTTGSPSTFFRFTGITMQGGSGAGTKYGALGIYGSSHNVRIDHDHFNIAGYSSSIVGGWVRFYGPELGVIDHNVADQGPNTNSDWNAFQIVTSAAAFEDSIGNGDGTFQVASQWGTINFVFIENNQINGGYGNDCDAAGLFVMRYNAFYGVTVAEQTHATKTDAGSLRGCRGFEFYHNYMTAGTIEEDAMTGTKGTTGLIWGNTMQSGTAYRFWAASTDRQTNAQTETNTPAGWGYCGTSVNSNGVGAPWDGNSNTASGYPCLDGIGRGQTTQALNGANLPKRLNSATGTIAWPHQYLEPFYLWMNSVGSAIEVNIRDSSTTQNVDVFADNANFNGTTGTGFGPSASRPSTCTSGPGGTYYTSPTGSYGVGYFATDANGGNGELYVCTSTNTWTGIYQPFTYPHPLVAGNGTGGNSPPPPQNVTTTVQ